MSTDLPFDKSQAQRTMDSDRTMFSSSPPRQTIPSFTNSPPSPPSNTKRSSSYSSPPPKNSSSSHKETSYSSVSSNSHENEQQRLAQEQQASYAMQDFGSRSNLNTNPSYPPSSKEEQFDSEEFQPPRPAYQQPLNNSGSGSDGGSVRSGNESSDDGLTATDSEDEFDWDEDDALEKEKEDATGMVRGKHRAKRGRRVYLWLMSLSRWFRTIIVAMFGCGVAIVPFVVVTVEYKGNPAKTEVQAWSLFLCIGWAVGCATSVIVDFLPNVFIMIILYSMGRVPEKIKSYVELLISILGWLKLLLQVVFAWVVLSVVRAAVSPPGNYWVYINRVMMALFAASLILLVEKFFLQVVAIGFHATSLKDRLEENHSALRALDKLSNAVPRIYARPNHHGFHHNRNKSHSNSNTNTTNTPSHSRPGSPAPMDFGYAPGTPSPLVNEKGPEGGVNTEEGKKRRSRFGIRARREERKEEKREETKKKKKNVAAKMVGGLGKSLKEFANKGMFGKGPEIGSLSSARQLARKLFANLEKERTGDVDGERVLIVEDFLPYFRNMEDAKSAFRHFDSDDNGDVSKREMRSAVQRIYRERKSLTASLADMSSAISKLDGVLLGVGVIIFIFAAMLIFNRSSTVASLVPLSTIVLGFSFIFANSAKTLFESLIFIFATHAFDVGDLVLIDEDWLFVKEFGLVSTTFRRVDGQEIIAPNALLATSKLIHNIRRSRAMWEVTSIQISYDTPLDVIEDLKTRVKAYLTENSREWGGGMQLDIDSITKQNAIAINIAIEHRNNWQDWGGRWGRRTAFMKALKGFLEDLEVTYSLPIQPVIWPSGIEDGSGGPMRPLPPGALEFGNAGSGGPYSSSGHLNTPSAGRPSLSVNTRTSR